jgi:hypothetical protein
MLPESNLTKRDDDLIENSIWVQDGGDGSFDSGDFILFYAAGPQQWLKDPASGLFRYTKNLYSDSAWYYINIGGTGKRVGRQSAASAGTPVTSFDDYYAHESDTVNFLVAERTGMAKNLGPARKGQNRVFRPVSGLITGTPITIITDVAARSAGQSSRFNVTLNRWPFMNTACHRYPESLMNQWLPPAP